MSLAPWRSPLAAALHRNRSLRYSRYLQLATVDLRGRPANRTVVFRGFLEQSDRLEVVTDARSQKIIQICHNPQVEACWYFPKTREQFRIGGHMAIADENCSDAVLRQERSRIWQTLSDAARSQFTWSAPGRDRSSEPEVLESPSPDPDRPLANFCLLLLDPDRVDRLSLQENPHERWIYQLEDNGKWSVRAVNP